MPVACHHTHNRLLPVSRRVPNVNAQHKLAIGHDVNGVDLPILLPKAIEKRRFKMDLISDVLRQLWVDLCQALC